MAGMKISVDAAMRARDVSPSRPADEAAAAAADARDAAASPRRPLAGRPAGSRPAAPAAAGRAERRDQPGSRPGWAGRSARAAADGPDATEAQPAAGPELRRGTRPGRLELRRPEPRRAGRPELPDHKRTARLERPDRRRAGRPEQPEPGRPVRMGPRRRRQPGRGRPGTGTMMAAAGTSPRAGSLRRFPARAGTWPASRRIAGPQTMARAAAPQTAAGRQPGTGGRGDGRGAC